MDNKKRNRKRTWKRAVAAILMMTVMVKDTYVAYAETVWPSHSTYKGDYNNSDRLYEWIRLDDERTDISTLVKPSYHREYQTYSEYFSPAKMEMVKEVYDHEITCYRMLLVAEYEGKTYFYQADTSRWVRSGEFGDCYGKSMIKPDETPQVQPGKKSFVTRGGLQAFYVEKAGICNWDYSYYKGDYQYRMYPCKPGTDDINEEVTLWYTRGNIYNDMWYYNKSGHPVGNNAWQEEWDDEFWFRDNFYQAYDKWTLSRASDDMVGDCPAFVFTAHKYEGGDEYDSHLQVKTFDGVVSLTSTYKGSRSTSSVHFGVYVGQPMDMEFGTSSDTKVDDVAALTSPYLIRRDQEYVVEKEGVLFVNDVVIIRGKIVNRGLIVVGNKGCIIQLDDEDSTQSITNEGGDLIVKKGGCILVDELISKEWDGRLPQIVNYGNILAEKKIALEKTLVDNSGELFGGCELKSQVLVRKVDYVQREDKKIKVQLADNFSLSKADKHVDPHFQYSASETTFINAPGSQGIKGIITGSVFSGTLINGK